MAFGTKKSLKNIQEAQAETLEAVYKLTAKTPEEKKAIDKAIRNGKNLKKSTKKLNKLQKKKEKQERKDARALKKNKKKLAKIEKQNAKKKDKLFTKQELKINDKLQAAKDPNADVSQLNSDKKEGLLDKVKDKAENVASKVSSGGTASTDTTTDALGVPTQSAGGEGTEENIEATSAVGEGVAQVSQKQDTINSNQIEATASINQLTQNKLNVIREDTEDIKEVVAEMKLENSDKDSQQDMLEKFGDDLDHVSESADALMDNSTNAAEADKKKNKSLIATLNQLHQNLVDKVEEKATKFYKLVYGIQFFFSHDFRELVKESIIAAFENIKQWIADKIDSLNPLKKKDTSHYENIVNDTSGKYSNKERISAMQTKLEKEAHNVDVEWTEKLKEFEESDEFKTLSKEDRNKRLEEINKEYSEKIDEANKKVKDFKLAAKTGNIDITTLNMDDDDKFRYEVERENNINEIIDNYKDMGEYVNDLTVMKAFAENPVLSKFVNKIKANQQYKFNVKLNSSDKDLNKSLTELYKYIPKQNKIPYLKIAQRIAPTEATKKWFVTKLLQEAYNNRNKDSDLLYNLVDETNGELFRNNSVISINDLLESDDQLSSSIKSIQDEKLIQEAKQIKKRAKAESRAKEVDELESEVAKSLSESGLNSLGTSDFNLVESTADLSDSIDSSSNMKNEDVNEELSRNTEPEVITEHHYHETKVVEQPKVIDNTMTVFTEKDDPNFGEEYKY